MFQLTQEEFDNLRCQNGTEKLAKMRRLKILKRLMKKLLDLYEMKNRDSC
ncbi:MAG: Unknown protein [uncultured Sulfurovum sp.]|uniref:Uncharacterized protein n=1 Tax=uncultured Sulfurovum sp. TaxID=269237 RepID=A0A6S6SDJ1_9BACT|nr:MAG: Unknown protein [uncultured Sulfurovum sp.]